MDINWVKEKLEGFHHLDHWIVESVNNFVKHNTEEDATIELEGVSYGKDEGSQLVAEKQLDDYKKNRLKVTEILMKGLQFVNKQSQPLQFMKKLELDPALLEQPLYH